VKGLIANNTIHPKIKEDKPNIQRILKLEYPKTFNDKRSALFLRLSKNHMEEIKIINGSNLNIIFGIYNVVILIGKKMDVSKFLKNSISSNKLSIIPKQ
tara:strand:- start:26 stop:322 length:297 start_codon:yes stop_codon:yes gene_type:complete